MMLCSMIRAFIIIYKTIAYHGVDQTVHYHHVNFIIVSDPSGSPILLYNVVK